jgi:hypothetical protein
VTTEAAVGPVVAGDEALAEFRRRLTGAHAVELLRRGQGRLLVRLAVGAGKTAWLVRVAAHVLAAGLYDLVIVLVPRTDILREVRRRLPPGLRPFVLRPRPRKRCGPLDAAWVEYERGGCAQLGRQQLCGGCPLRPGCRWPGRHSRLRGARLVLATQAQLRVNPQLVQHLRRLTGARRALLLFDESDLLVRSTEQAISARELSQFLDAQRAVMAAAPAGGPSRTARRWLEMTELVAAAPSQDLQGGDWTFPAVGGPWAVAVQRAGRRLHGAGFRFLGYDLHALADSDRWSRERLPDGGLRFARPPSLGRDFILFSGSMSADLVRYRLDPNHRRPPPFSPFEGVRFAHPGTKWYNIASLAGAALYFPSNAGAILDFFGELIARNIRAGKRTLLVARKPFRRRCALHLRQRLKELGVGPVRVVTGDWDRHDLTDPRTLPLINYGLSGVNRFEDFDCVYCLTGYYVDAEAVSQAVHDIDGSAERYAITVGWGGRPPRRRALVALPDARETNLPRIAQAVLEQREADVVLQAVGRVRPFTRPREVITFQADELPGVRYALRFESLAAARSYFGVATRQQSRRERLAAEVRLRKALGQRNGEISEALGISLSTFKRYARRGAGQNS